MLSSICLTNFPFFPNKGIGIHLSALYVSVHQSPLSLPQACVSFLHMISKAMYSSPSTWETLNTDLPWPMSQSENPLVRKYIHLITVGKIHGFLGVSAGTHYVEGGKTEWVLLYQERWKKEMLNFLKGKGIKKGNNLRRKRGAGLKWKWGT